MKRWIKVTCLAFLASSSLLWGRFYVGVEGGYMRDRSVYEYEEKGTTKSEWEKKVLGNGLVGNITLGTEHFFGRNYYGVRWGIFGGYGASKSKDSEFGESKLTTFWAGANFDMFFNFYAKEEFMTGMFMGVEYDYIIQKPSKEAPFGVSNKTQSNNLALRVGLSTLFGNHHRLELLAKVPVYVQDHDKKIAPSKYEFQYEYIQGLLAYKYVF